MNAHTKLRTEEWTEEDFALYDDALALQARENFWAFRNYMRPTFKAGWWNQLITAEYENFYRKLVNNERPMLVLMSPPQHGKSVSVEDFAAWLAGKRPDMKQIYASFSDDLGIRTNMQLQRMIDSVKYNKAFPMTYLNASNVVTVTGKALRNSSLLEFVGQSGSFRNTTVQGQVTGQGLDIAYIDDPIKGRAEAQSPTTRNKTWNWLIDDFFTRFSEYAGIIMTMTRWHIDDPVGRWLEHFPDTRVISFPAIAVEDEPFRKAGEALFPEHKSLDFLLARKEAQSQASWESLYQQRPILVGGGMFPIEKFEIEPSKPHPRDVRKTVRYWDKAGTAEGGAYTVGCRMHWMKNGMFVVSDIRRGQWSYMDREKIMRNTAETDNEEYGPCYVHIEQEPGSGGKESAERSVMNLRGFIVKVDPVRGNKELRAEPYATQVQAGNVRLVAGDWNNDFIDEHETFPGGKYKDQVDAAGGAFVKLAVSGSSYDSTLSWVTNNG